MKFFSINNENTPAENDASLAPDNIIEKVCNGELIVWKQCLQELNAFDHIEELLYAVIAHFYGVELARQIKSKGLHYIHEHLNNLEIEKIYVTMRSELANKMPAFTVELFRKLGLEDPFYVHNASLIRMMTPYKNMRAHQDQMPRHLGKLSLHGPHHDHYQNVPLNAINTWIAVGPVRKENGMFVYTDHWGTNLPQGEEIVRSDQYLGHPTSIVLDPGDALIFHSNHLHSSRLNTTDETRIVLTNRISVGLPEYPDPAQPQFYYPSDAFSHENDMTQIFRMDFSVENNNNTNVPNLAKLNPVVPADHLNADKNIPPETDIKLTNVYSNLDDAIARLPEGEVGSLGKYKCVAKVDGEISVFKRFCPHQGADMAGGFIEDGSIVCPFHGVKFSLKNGQPNCEGVSKLKKG